MELYKHLNHLKEWLESVPSDEKFVEEKEWLSETVILMITHIAELNQAVLRQAELIKEMRETLKNNQQKKPKNIIGNNNDNFDGSEYASKGDKLWLKITKKSTGSKS